RVGSKVSSETVAMEAKEKVGSPERRLWSGFDMLEQFSGDYCGGATPDPIPNSEVKPSSADGTAGGTLWESRSLPDLWAGGSERIRRPFFFGFGPEAVRPGGRGRPSLRAAGHPLAPAEWARGQGAVGLVKRVPVQIRSYGSPFSS